MNLNKYIWVIGSPRSGTTLLTNYIGKYTDLNYNEPFSTHSINDCKTWNFPIFFNSLVFKYCVNWMNAKFLFENFKKSYFVHVFRCPKNTVYSLAFSKKNSFPCKNFYDESFLTKIQKKDLSIDEKFDYAIKKWFIYTTNSFSVIKQYEGINIKYEKIDRSISKISDYLQIKFDEKIKFNNRNNIDVNLDMFNYFEKKWSSSEYRNQMVLRKKIEYNLFV